MEREHLTHCPYCSLNCGLKLLSEADRVTGYRKWRRSPFSQGGLCAKGVTAWEQIHHADRLPQPLVRRGGSYVEVEWDTALDEAAAGLQRVIDQLGAAATGVLTGASLTNEKAYLVGKFARLALGTPNVDPNGRMCMSSAGAAYSAAFGIDRAALPLEDIPGADLIVIIGANLHTSYPLFMPHLARARRKGAGVMVIDPRDNKLVRPGDLHVALRPGTDAALAAGLLRAVDDAGGVDHEFIAGRTSGYDAARAAAEPWTLARCANVTGVPSDVIATAASWIARAQRMVIMHARGSEQQSTGTSNVRAWINLALAAGQVGRPGCGIITLTGQRNGQGAREHGQRADQLPGYRRIDDPDDRAVIAARWGVDTERLPGRGLTYVEILQAAARGEISALLVLSTNPVVSAPHSRAVAQALAALEHLVVIDPFFSETCAFASVVLPGATFAEEEGTITTTDGRVVRIDQAIPPQAIRSELDILRGLASRFGVREHFDFHTGREVFAELCAVSRGGPADYSGMDWEALRSAGGIFWPAPREQPKGTRWLHQERFATPDGRARFAAVTPPVSESGLDAFPLLLTTGRHRDHYLSGNQTRRIPKLLESAPEPVLEVHPDAAAAAGLIEGVHAHVTSAQGSVSLAWTANANLRRDTLFVPYHWPGINALTDDTTLDPVSRIPALKRTPVQIAPHVAAPTPTAAASLTPP